MGCSTNTAQPCKYADNCDNCPLDDCHYAPVDGRKFHSGRPRGTGKYGHMSSKQCLELSRKTKDAYEKHYLQVRASTLKKREENDREKSERGN